MLVVEQLLSVAPAQDLIATAEAAGFDCDGLSSIDTLKLKRLPDQHFSRNEHCSFHDPRRIDSLEHLLQQR